MDRDDAGTPGPEPDEIGDGDADLYGEGSVPENEQAAPQLPDFVQVASVVSGGLSFSVSTDATGATLIVAIAGGIDAYSAPWLREQLRALLERPWARCVVDLRTTPFLDSAGHGVLFGFARRSKEQHQRDVCFVAGGSVRRLFWRTGMDQVVLVVDDLTQLF